MEPDIPPPTYEEAISGETQTSGENNTSVQYTDNINPSLTNNIIDTQPLPDTTTYEETTGETHTSLCENNSSVQHIDDINPSLTNNIIGTQPLPDTPTTHEHQRRKVHYKVVERPSRYHSRNAMIVSNNSASTGIDSSCCECLCDCSESTEIDLDCRTNDIRDCCELLCQCCSVLICCFCLDDD